jgi:hypothetical protein
MRQKIIFFVALFYCSVFVKGQSKVYIGRNMYSFNRLSGIEKDDNNTYIENFFVEIRHKNFKNALLSFCEKGVRNDSIMRRGFYSFNAKTKELIIKNFFYNKNQYLYDSTYIIFSQLKNANFVLKESIDFKNGNMIKKSF